MTPADTFTTERQPRGLNIGLRGRSLVAAGQKSNSATLYAIDPQSGAIKELQRIALGKTKTGSRSATFHDRLHRN
ncbi:beta-propeller fold lactonase family protein [Bosea sp. OAE752]|uniref:beta-propeller fold lactonase family protein n=1 Tax=Bosea sp. OAE752 TaxID=2663873 RepID=UPI003D2472B5